MNKNKGQKIAVVGSRTYDDEFVIDAELLAVIDPEDTIITGGARGVDSIAEYFGNKKNIHVEVYEPNYERYGRAAPIQRNHVIAQRCDWMIAFWNGRSKGTLHAISCAVQNGKDVEIRSTNKTTKTRWNDG